MGDLMSCEGAALKTGKFLEFFAQLEKRHRVKIYVETFF